MGLHKEMGDVVIGVCDKELVGRVFLDGDLVLDLKKYKKFYGEEEDSEKIKEMLTSATVINLVGKNAIAIAVEAGVITKKDVKNAVNIGGVEHIQVFRVDKNAD